MALISVDILASLSLYFARLLTRRFLPADYDWSGVAHGCTRKLGMKICGKLKTFFFFFYKSVTSMDVFGFRRLEILCQLPPKRLH